MALNDFFVWGQGGRKITPEEAARERALSETILQRAGDTSPIGHWSQGAARVLDALGGVVRQRRAEAGEQEIATANKGIVDRLSAALLGGSPSAASSAIPMTSAAGEVAATAPGSAIAAGGPEAYRNAIASIESAGSGDYSAVGPTNKNLGRALGRYQIMEANIGPWSQEAIGRTVTPDEFLADPALQDAIFDAKFGQYVQQFGPEGAAQAWFAGPGGVGKTERKDVLGTTVGDYGQKFVTALGASPATSPASAAIEAVAPTAQTGGLRPFQPGETRPNPDGSYSTEITTTWQLPDGSWVNVPSLWMGPNGPQEFSVDDEDSILGAMQQFEAQNGPTFQRFGSEQEAVSAAEARSSEGGAGAGPQLMADFSGSNQLSNAQGGIIPALTGGIPASPEQIARAQAAAQAPIEVAGGGDRVPMAATGTSGINPAIIEALTDPQASPQTQRIAGILLEQQQRQAQAAEEQRLQAADPMRRIELESAQIKLDQLRNPTPGFRPLSTEEKTALGLPPQGSFQMSREGQISQIGGGGVNITNEGTIPAGYQAVRDAQGRVTSVQPLPGSPAALEMEQALRSRETQGGRKETATDIITNAASSARNLIKTGTLATGTLGRLAANLSESDAAELRRQVDVLKSNATIENLTAMRQASPTGGALGSVTEKEGAMLAAAAGAIDPDAGAKQVEKGLDNYERNLLRIIHGPKVGDAIFEQTRQEKPITEMTDEELEALANGD